MKINIYKFLQSWLEWQRIPRVLGLAAMLLCPLLLHAQQSTYTLKGNVKDKSGPVPGVSVLVEGTSTGTITDQNGDYQLSLTTDRPTARLVFSFIGYQQQIQQVSLTAETVTMDATMAEDVRQLDEVVVTGSTIKQNKRELGNNISTVS